VSYRADGETTPTKTTLSVVTADSKNTNRSKPKCLKILPLRTYYFFITTSSILARAIIFRLSIAWSVPEIFAIVVYSCPKSSARLITHEPLHITWWNFARMCILTIVRTLLNFKVIGQRSRSHGFLVFFCVRDTAATRGQYLALSKAWRSCFF